MAADSFDKNQVIEILDKILEIELAGTVRYTHYSFMVFGHGRIPIVQWMREQASEGLLHAASAGEHITTLGGHPSLKIGPLLETHKHDIDQLLDEAIEHEKKGVALYYQLHELVEGKNVTLEEYARAMIAEEEAHISEIEKMIRAPGSIEPAR